MSSITQLRIWNDPGFTENCLEVPKKGATLPSPSRIIAGPLNPSKGRMFTSIQVREDYVTLMNASYVAVYIDMNNSADLTLYGWVDSVVLESDTDGYPMTTINWHIDYWRTYISQARFGSGMVRRRPLKSNDVLPPQSYPYRYMTNDTSFTTTIPAWGETWWVLMYVVQNITDESGSGTTSVVKWMTWPVHITNPSGNYGVGNSTAGGPAPSMNDVFLGRLEEVLGLDPQSIFYACLVPVPPNIDTYNGSVSRTSVKGWTAEQVSDNANSWVLTASGPSAFDTTTRELLTESTSEHLMTSDNVVYGVTGYSGELLKTLPWGIAFNTVAIRLIASASSVVVMLSFLDNTGEGSDASNLSPAVNGMTVAVPAITIDVTSNAWSSYVYSGARQAEMDQRQLQAESQAVSGGISTGVSALNGALSGAVLGAMVGTPGGPLGMAAGALIGGVTSALGGALSTGANYAYQTGAYADEMQRISDYSASNQTNTINIPGGSWDFFTNGIFGIHLVKMDKDEYSVTQRDNDIELYGVNVSEPMESCQALVNAGGPLQITNLTVTGNIPVEAKQFFRTRLSKGVRMI